MKNLTKMCLAAVMLFGTMVSCKDKTTDATDTTDVVDSTEMAVDTSAVPMDDTQAAPVNDTSASGTTSGSMEQVP